MTPDPLAVLEARVREARSKLQRGVELHRVGSGLTVMRYEQMVNALIAAAEALGRARGIAECQRAVRDALPYESDEGTADFVIDILAALEKTT